MHNDVNKPHQRKTASNSAGFMGAIAQEGRDEATGTSDAMVPLKPQAEQPDGNGSEALVTLHDRSLDAAKGFASMVNRAKQSLRSVSEGFRTMHDQHASIIGQLLIDRGVQPDRD